MSKMFSASRSQIQIKPEKINLTLPAYRPKQKRELPKLDLQGVLYSYQKKIIEDRNKFILAIMSRQVGKSFSFAFKAVLNSLINQPTIFISTNNRNAQKLISTAKKHIEFFRLITGEELKLDLDNKNELQIHGKPPIISVANNPDTAVGHTGHIVIDEASRFQNSKEILDAVIPFTTRGFSLSMVSTPLGKRGMLWDAYEKSLLPNSNWTRHMVDIYEAIKMGCPADVDLIRAEMDEISFRQNYLCEFIDDAGAFFTFELLSSIIDEDLENMNYEQISDIKNLKIAGYDPAKKVDSGAFSILDKNRDGIIRVIHLKEFKKTDYSVQIDEIVTAVKKCGIYKLLVDATGVGVKIAEDLKRVLGSIVVEITYTNAIKEKLVTNLKIAAERKSIRIPDNRVFFDQLHRLQREVMDSGKTRYGHESGMHDDLVFSVANALSGFDGYGLAKQSVDRIVVGKSLSSLKGAF